MISQASAAVSTNLNNLMSSGEIVPASESASKSMIRVQNSLPNNKTGISFIRFVWINVSVSNNSSKVPKPPGNTVMARARIKKCILRIAK